MVGVILDSGLRFEWSASVLAMCDTLWFASIHIQQKRIKMLEMSPVFIHLTIFLIKASK